MKVLRQIEWVRLTDVRGRGGLVGNLTHCEHEGVEFYVRENVDLDTFHITSSERWGMHSGQRLAKRHTQILELCAPEREWVRLWIVVKRADVCGRPVLRNRQFTVEWAEKQFEEKPLHKALRIGP